MAIEIEKTFDVPQSPEKVWGFLTDPACIVQCLPGATLLGALDERTFEGEIGMKLGPIGTVFRGTITFEELDAERHRVVMVGQGKDEKGTGNVRMTMTSDLTPGDEGGTHVWVSQNVSLTGKLASFGRGGVIQAVADVVFGRFTGCVQEKLAEGPAG
ncbi:MAG: SRPBCC family protein [Gemmatimonadetes bacterium]|nr:SRPBCC family protein [Gemmatimonadota bacterium]